MRFWFFSSSSLFLLLMCNEHTNNNMKERISQCAFQFSPMMYIHFSSIWSMMMGYWEKKKNDRWIMILWMKRIASRFCTSEVHGIVHFFFFTINEVTHVDWVEKFPVIRQFPLFFENEFLSSPQWMRNKTFRNCLDQIQTSKWERSSRLVFIGKGYINRNYHFFPFFLCIQNVKIQKHHYRHTSRRRLIDIFT